MTCGHPKREKLDTIDGNVGVSSTAPYKRESDSSDSDRIVICYWCRTPINERATEWRGEPVHAGCPA